MRLPLLIFCILAERAVAVLPSAGCANQPSFNSCIANVNSTIAQASSSCQNSTDYNYCILGFTCEMNRMYIDCFLESCWNKVLLAEPSLFYIKV